MDERSVTRAARDHKDELLESIFESASNFAIYTTDESGTATSWNVGAKHLFGFSEEEMLGQSGDIIFTPEDRAAGVPDLERQRARADGRAVDERWHQRKDGSRFWASGLLMPLRSGAGYSKMAWDRTEQHEAEQRAREQEARFHLLATSVPQLVFTTFSDGDRIWPSPQWVDYTGFSSVESVGQGWLEAIHPDDREATRTGWLDASAKGEYHAEHRVWSTTDGEYRWHQTRARPLPGPAGPAEWIGTMTDIHDLRTLKDRQAVLLAELQHRTRNLLGVVQALVHQTIKKSDTLATFKAAYEQRLQALSRVQSMLAVLDFGEVSLRSLVEAELIAHGDGAIHTGKIQTDGPDVALAPTAAQALALGIHELATNAVKYGALAQPSGRLMVTWSLSRQGRHDVATVEWRESGVAMPDHGPGVRKGYGTELITKALPYQLKAKTELTYGSDGVRCTIEVPVKEVSHGE